MRELGFETFFVAGHDRGARTAFRMALDHPERVLKAAFLDILPTHHVWTEVSMAWAINSYHWMFMAQPYDFPQRLLRGNEAYYIRKKLTRQGLGKGASPRRRSASTCASAPRADPRRMRGLPRSRHHRLRDGHRRFQRGPEGGVPGARAMGRARPPASDTSRAVGRGTARTDVRMQSLPCGHYPSEQAPRQTYEELQRFFAGA